MYSNQHKIYSHTHTDTTHKLPYRELEMKKNNRNKK